MNSPVAIVPGCLYWPGWLDREGQEALAEELRHVLAEAPLFTPLMPRTGKPFSVRMSNCGPLGWVSDVGGYRYQETHPETGRPWPPFPPMLSRAWEELAGRAPAPEACLINWYGPQARMGLHQDRDEEEFSAPVLSLSLGDTALFRIGGTTRSDPTRSLRLASGDALLLSGPARLAFHGIDRLYPGTSTLLKQPGRINLTLRRVRQAGAGEIRP
ncbi:alpha-ketoglutarate-dependent dioxygenase AlkB [Ancylobacter sp. IITR112]|uniref:alpha-ketoglutarate-dependent dioxygenase AlkB family protein n=1 Tax=Ancylobacter sp. IITR112 TaxID=3138073 RepID=UPI00352BB507